MQGHSADAGHPARADRGRDHRGLRDPRARTRSSTCAARWCRCCAGCRPRSPRPTRPATSAHDILGSGFDLELIVHAGRGRLHLRRGDRAAGLAGGQARPAAAAPAVPRGRRPVRLPDRGQQRRVHRQRARRSSATASTGSGRWARRSRPGFTLYSLSGHVTTARAVRGAAGHHAARAARLRGRGAGRAPAEVLDARAARRPRC